MRISHPMNVYLVLIYVKHVYLAFHVNLVKKIAF